MNRTSLMLRDASYMAKLLYQLPQITDEESRQKAERIILRLMHRNNMLFTNSILIVFTELEQAGLAISDRRAVDLIQARLYNLIRQSCGIADENNKLITAKEKQSK